MTRDPYRCDGPTLVNFSGGRSSAYMVHAARAAHGGFLPADASVVFTNTGVEREETLRFVADVAARWGVEVRWIERDGSTAAGWRETDYERASRHGEPFDELIDEKKFLPNAVIRLCTPALKIEPAAAFMRAQGFDRWTSVVGLRRDEPARVAKIRARDHGDWDVACPLYDAGVRKADVAAFWSAQPFRLALKPWESNCSLCFMKSRATRERIAREHPELVDWWAAAEARIGARFHAHEKGYAAMAERVRRLPLLPMDLDPAAPDESIACGCTDRRVRMPSSCTCRKKPGQGHALRCARVLGQEAA